MKAKVSIIVPIYNAEKWLERCIESILNQTHKKMEIILINDGSKDKSKEIVEKYHDERIIFIDKENTGVSATRNLGIEKSSGDYIMFVDSDDYIESNTVEKLLKKALKDKCDLVVCNYFLEISRTLEIKMPLFNDCSLKENPDLVTIINFAPWNKLYHKNLLKKTDNRFPLGLKYEDAPVVIQAIRDAKKIGIIEDCLFHYVMQKTGETITRDKRIFDIISICEIINEKLLKCTYVDRTNLTVKILLPYLKNSRYINDLKLRNEFIDTVYKYLNAIDKKWRKSKCLNDEPIIKKIILKNKVFVKLVGMFKM
ncbi:MAG: glycosyltransferase family 2 protein [Firmicutes bacterium]|nr:glycosyltransferase family 2 protein [Bacillota bacterium]